MLNIVGHHVHKAPWLQNFVDFRKDFIVIVVFYFGLFIKHHGIRILCFCFRPVRESLVIRGSVLCKGKQGTKDFVFQFITDIRDSADFYEIAIAEEIRDVGAVPCRFAVLEREFQGEVVEICFAAAFCEQFGKFYGRLTHCTVDGNYQKALEAFHEKYPNITVSPTYGAWSGWEEKQSTALAADQGSDVMQVNWNWLYQYSPTGEKFVDLREYSDVIDLSQWSDTAKNACIVADSLQAVPISMTGRIFYWNMNTFKQAGIEAVPTSYDDLIAAGKAFQEKLGDDYYPLAIGQYDRMILMTFYLESKYGKAWVENNECQYSEEEIVDGLNFIKSLEDNHVIPTRPTMIAAGFDSIDKSQEWIDGKYAGIFEWDSAPSKYQSALADNSGFTVGEEIKFGDKANGGFSKVSMGMAITKSCQHPVEAAALIDFLWNGEGAAIMGSECGIPASTAGLAAAQAADAVKPLVLEANTKVLAFVDMPLDPYYESSKLKDTTDGVYTDVFDGFSYGDYDAEEAAEILLDGVSGVLSANA